MKRRDVIEMSLNSKGRCYWRILLAGGHKGSHSPPYYPKGTKSQSISSCRRTVTRFLARNPTVKLRDNTNK